MSSKYPDYRKIWSDVHGPIPVDIEERSYDIHHIDGNRENNSIDNLYACSIQEHFDIHKGQGDTGAAYALGKRLKISKEEFSRLSKATQKKNVENGTHNFLGGNIQRETSAMRKIRGDIFFTEEARHEGGKLGIQVILARGGWSDSEIEKRVNTRHERDNYSKTMSQCHSPEALDKRAKTKIKKALTRIVLHYNEPFSYNLLKRAHKEKVSGSEAASFMKHFSEADIHLYSSLLLQGESI